MAKATKKAVSRNPNGRATLPDAEKKSLIGIYISPKEVEKRGGADEVRAKMKKALKLQ